MRSWAEDWDTDRHESVRCRWHGTGRQNGSRDLAVFFPWNRAFFGKIVEQKERENAKGAWQIEEKTC